MLIYELLLRVLANLEGNSLLLPGRVAIQNGLLVSLSLVQHVGRFNSK